MVLQWMEREHEDLDNDVIESDEALEALRLCGLKIFFEMNGMRAQPRMIQKLVTEIPSVMPSCCMDNHFR